MKMTSKYFDKTISKDEEKLLTVGLSKWYVYPYLILLGLLSFIFVIVTLFGGNDTDCTFFVIIFTLLTLYNYLKAKCTEHVISNQRISAKTGIISRNTEELKMKKVESCEVKQDFNGRLLNYGDIIFRGTGSSYVTFKNIDNPLERKREVENIIEKYNNA